MRRSTVTFQGVRPGILGERGEAITITEACKRYNVSFVSFYNWMRDGSLPVVGRVVKTRRQIPVLWTADIEQRIAAMPPNRGKFTSEGQIAFWQQRKAQNAHRSA